MMQPRDFADVLAATIAEVPAEAAELRRRLTTVLEDSGFTAPEIRWQQLGWKVEAIIEAGMAGASLADLAEGWRAKVLAAWMGTEPAAR